MIKKYKTYRRIGMMLNQKMMKAYLDRDLLFKAAGLLGMVSGNTLIFESEDETSVLMDFALYECVSGNKSVASTYREKAGWESEEEKDILDALLSSYTSLFRITSINDPTLFLEDILNKKGDIPLTDIALSKTAVLGMLLFTRLLSFNDFNMTSGAAFAFPPGLEEYLLKRYKKLSKKVESGNESVKRFVAFYKSSKSSGLKVKYEKPAPRKESWR